MQLPAVTYLVVALVAGLFAASIAQGRRRGSARDRAVRALAARRGWRYAATDPAGLGDLRFRSFADAAHALVTNVVTTDAGDGRVRVFDYSLQFTHEARGEAGLVTALADDVFGGTTAAPRTVRTYSKRCSAGVVRVDAFLPPLTAAPSSLWSRAAETLGADDHDFESLEFNRHWDVRCRDDRFTWLFCDASLIDLVLELGRGVTVETFGNYVLVTRALLDDADALEHFVDVLARLPRALNPLVIAEYPTVAAMEARAMTEAWRNRPDGRGGVF